MGDERQSKLCASAGLAGGCGGRASPHPARQCPFNWTEHLSQRVVCPLGCSFLASAHGDRQLCQTDRQTDLFMMFIDINMTSAAEQGPHYFPVCCCCTLGKAFSLCHLLSWEPRLEHSDAVITTFLTYSTFLMDSESFTGDRQCFCFTNRMQRRGQMAVTQTPVLLISNLQLYPTHYLQEAVAFRLHCARATKP